MSFDVVEFPVDDLSSRAVERTLRQFRDSGVLQRVLAAFVAEIQMLRDAEHQVLELRTAAKAAGLNEETIGRIVGLSRVTFDYGRLNWFTPDDTLYPPDKTMAWVTGAAIGTLQQVGDETYRSLIEAKVYRNFTRFGAIPEIVEAIRTAFGTAVAFLRQPEPMDFYIVLQRATPDYVKNFLTVAVDNNTVDDVYYAPYPMTWRITGIVDLEDYVLLDDFTGETLTGDGYEFLTGDGG